MLKITLSNFCEFLGIIVEGTVSDISSLYIGLVLLIILRDVEKHGSEILRKCKVICILLLLLW